MSMDGTDRLCHALYGRPAACNDYLGGSEAKMLHDAADALAAERARTADLERRLREAEAESATLRGLVETLGKCRRCGGMGTVVIPCSFCGDSTYDHECNDEMAPCDVCDGTGMCADARRALEVKP